MSGSGAGEMAPTSSKVMVFPKFDMHVYTFELTSSKLEAAVTDYLIPMDLHPRLPPPGMMMDKLPAIGFLSRIKLGMTRGNALRRHGDTDLYDDFPSNFNQDDAERLSEFLVPLRPPPCHLLYVCGLTTACRHLGFTYSIKDQDKNVISIDTFLKLPTWTGTIVSKGDPIPEDQCPKSRVTPPLPEGFKISNLAAFQRSVEMPNTKIAAAREKKERQSLARAEAKRAGVGHACGSRKKRKEVADLSGNTRVSTPAATANQPSPSLGHHDADENLESDKRDLEPKTQQLMAAEEKVKMLERERLSLSTQLSQSEADRKKLVKEFILTVVKRLHTSVEYRKSLVAPVQLCFTARWLGGLALGRTKEEKITDSCDLPLSELWSVHLDAPSSEGVTLGGAAERTVQQPPSISPKITSDIPFGTTT
nr:hypothetical protein [Tanacetum cinerariifolium]